MNYLFFSITLCFINLVCYSSVYYVDSNFGNDCNVGTSISAPWKSLARVNNTRFFPGDSILFKRGEVFRGSLMSSSGSEDGFVTYAAYGTGSKPRLFGSLTRSLVTHWVKDKGSIWRTICQLNEFELVNFENPEHSTPFPLNDVGNVIYDNENACGKKEWDEAKLDSQGEFWFDKEKSVLKVFSESNPASYYKQIELSLSVWNIHASNKSYNIYKDLDLRYAGNGGIGMMDGAHHVLINEVDLSFIGGARLRDTTRYGNGIQLWNGASDVTIIGCKISQIYDSGISPQGRKEGQLFENLFFKNNIIDMCEQSFEIWVRGKNAKMSNTIFENNVCSNAGKGWSHTQRKDPNGTHLLFWGFAPEVSVTNVFIRNNLFYDASDWGIFWNKNTDIDKVVFDSNCWIMTGRKPFAKIGESNSQIYNLDSYKLITGHDKNSTEFRWK